jgi:hypothetical protein
MTTAAGPLHARFCGKIVQHYLTQLLTNLPVTATSELEQWLPDEWKRQNPKPSAYGRVCGSDTEIGPIRLRFGSEAAM